MRGIIVMTLAAVLSLLTTCHSESGTAAASGAAPYFDLKKYLESEITRLEKAQGSVVKTVSVNGKEEQQTLQQLDYRSELAPLLDADINRPAWQGKYRVDSTRVSPGEWTLTYTAADEKPPVRTLSVHFQDNAVESILIERTAHTLMAGSSQQLSYRPAAGFEVATVQKAVFMQERKIFVGVAY
ncbi:MAG TPA: hypothetical protein PK198_14890 [Saprospiraceae bacterium]|nr:hypothetical protein [Saprospiraceae bacterium]HRJ14318.1 hypothetical protein [Saprospiraceae bacterium]HRK84021.1 hypothetical protein [Saprospiraceae bacterium]